MTAALALGACAPIDATSTVTVEPLRAGGGQRSGGAPVVLGNEQRVSTDFRVDYVQLGPRLMVEVHTLDSCVQARHRPVLRVESIERGSRGFVPWDFGLSAVTGGLAALAFARPNLFGNRLVDDQGRVVYDNTTAWVTGGAFAAMSAILLAAGVINAVRATDSVRYAEAYTLELGPIHPCPDTSDTPSTPDQGERAADRSVRLRVLFADGEHLETQSRTDESGRAALSLPPWPSERELPADGSVAAVLDIGLALGEGWEPRVPSFQLRAPWAGVGAGAGANANTGVADTREIPRP